MGCLLFVCFRPQSAVDAGAISARAKPAAAAEKAAALQAALKARGCKEEFVPDPELMADGQVRYFATNNVIMWCCNE